MTPSIITFCLLTLFVIGSGLIVAFTKNILHSVFGLLGVAISMTGYFLLLSAPWTALIFILIYTALTFVVFLFVILLTRRKEIIATLSISHIGYVLVLSGLLIVFMSLSLLQLPGVTEIRVVAPEMPLLNLGKSMVSPHFIVIELFSLTLVILFVGLVTLIRREVK